MKALLSPRFDNRLVRRIFEIKALTINGEYAPETQQMSPSALYACQYVVGAPMDRLYTFFTETGSASGSGAVDGTVSAEGD